MKKLDVKKLHYFLSTNRKLRIVDDNFYIKAGVNTPYNVLIQSNSVITYEGNLENEDCTIFAFMVNGEYLLWVYDYDLSKLLSACVVV